MSVQDAIDALERRDREATANAVLDSWLPLEPDRETHDHEWEEGVVLERLFAAQSGNPHVRWCPACGAVEP